MARIYFYRIKNVETDLHKLNHFFKCNSLLLLYHHFMADNMTH